MQIWGLKFLPLPKIKVRQQSVLSSIMLIALRLYSKGQLLNCFLELVEHQQFAPASYLSFSSNKTFPLNDDDTSYVEEDMCLTKLDLLSVDHGTNVWNTSIVQLPLGKLQNIPLPTLVPPILGAVQPIRLIVVHFRSLLSDW